MKNQVQLIAYVDRLGAGGFGALRELLGGPLAGLFGGVHLLPFFWPIDGADAGFDPIDHTKVDARLGTWDDVRLLAAEIDVMADLIVNHVSSRSPQFEDFRERGDASPNADLFLTFANVFPNGASERDLLRIYRPRPGLPFTKVRLCDGSDRLLWTTFTPEQIDIDVRSEAGARYLLQVLDQFQGAGIRAIRMDAAGYAIKKAGTSCFLIPETFAFSEALTREANQRGIEVLVEVHSYFREQIEIAKQVDWVYDFALPPLILHALFEADGGPLKRWLEISPRNAVSVLDTHDGIGVIDVGAGARGHDQEPGLLSPVEMNRLVETIHERSGGQSRQATGAAANNLDLYQVNCTYFDALGRREDEYLIARALQFFSPGIPQVYYVGLLAGVNDMALLKRSGVGRDINRHYYSREEIQRQLDGSAVVTSLLDLVRFRNSHPAFQGDFSVLSTADDVVALAWRRGDDFARLRVDLRAMAAIVDYSSIEGEQRMAVGVGAIEGL